MQVQVSQARLAGEVLIPASKSHTIRALLLATMASGTSHIYNPLDSSDTEAALAACRGLGANIIEHKDYWEVEGVSGAIQAADNVIDTMNSGTTLYLAASLAALADNWTVFTGDASIRNRPIGNLLQSLQDLGAQSISTKNNGKAPFLVKGPLKGGKTSIECPTSQFLSSLLIALPLASGDSEISVPLLHERPYVEMTLKWLDEQKIQYTHNSEMSLFTIPGNQKYKAYTKSVPGDFSSATFFLCAAAICGTTITLKGLDMTDSQGDKAVVHMMEDMGCKISITEEAITIDGSHFHGATLDLNATPDALPALAAAACFAKGTTYLTNVPQARLKETDRIAVMAQELTKMGAVIEEKEDGLIIHQSSLTGTNVNGHHDHRIIMALAIAGLGSEGITRIDTAEAVSVTFPNFFELVDSLKI
ncbi:3-phosphoshikimate 1-carboxyvinyltransferase [Spirochaeta cellobiosiphila]|uniref:3-phosphoshikimate 1-carboxyvinyltransferase n=1 Tax=Spirochaeta cellobiosiphila TaxID=504483 RepID=UPI0003F606F1|nr:3-phosphoshikimate 1-carboxyvinyltransferase [Spirochaeta cellobiosiphila]